MIYETNIQELGEQLTPPRLRKDFLLALLEALLAPFQWLKNQFSGNRDANLWRLGVLPSVTSLTKALNDFFGVQNIYITDGDYTDPLWLALAAELQPLPLALQTENQPLWLGLANESGFMGASFIIHAPTALKPRDAEIRAFVNNFKLAGKTFSIQYF